MIARLVTDGLAIYRFYNGTVFCEVIEQIRQIYAQRIGGLSANSMRWFSRILI